MHGTIQKWGNSQAVRIPKAILETAFLKENDSVRIIAQEGQIIIKKAVQHEHKTTKQRLEEFYGKNINEILEENAQEPDETDWGEPVGDEIW